MIVFPNKEKEMKRHPSSLEVVVLIVGFTLAAGLAWAGPQLKDLTVSACATLNCSSETYEGSYNQDSDSASDPLVLQLYGSPNECLRFEVTSEEEDLELVVISPSGTVRRNDDCNFPAVLCPRCPCVKFVADVKGWYTLQASQFQGQGLNLSRFTLRYGRYTPATNPNCTNPEAPLAASELESAKSEASQ
jgi:hypothetical protein